MKFDCEFISCKNMQSGALRIQLDVPEIQRSDVAAFLLNQGGKALSCVISDGKGFSEEDMKALREKAHVAICQYAAKRGIDWILLKKELLTKLFPGRERFHSLSGEDLGKFIMAVESAEIGVQ